MINKLIALFCHIKTFHKLAEGIHFQNNCTKSYIAKILILL